MEIDPVIALAKKKSRFKKLPFLKDKLESHLHPMIILTPLAHHSFKLGESRIGNGPDLPKGFDWPHIDDRPATCLAQINLEDLKELAPDLPLGDKGHLYFFIESNWTGSVSRSPKSLVLHLNGPLELSKDTSQVFPLQCNRVYVLPTEIPEEFQEDLIDTDYIDKLCADYRARLIRSREMILRLKLKPLSSAEEKKVREEIEQLQEPFIPSSDCVLNDTEKEQIAKLNTEYTKRCQKARALAQKFNLDPQPLSNLELTGVSAEERKVRKEIEQLMDPWVILLRENSDEEPDEIYDSFAESLLSDQLKIEQVKNNFSLLGYPSTQQHYDETNDRVLLFLSSFTKLKNTPPNWNWDQLVFFISKADLKAGRFDNIRAEHLFD
jgi:uncharacterized protein YwqG